MPVSRFLYPLVLLGLLSCSSDPEELQKPSVDPEPGTTADGSRSPYGRSGPDRTGAEIYTQVCQLCHTASGRGNFNSGYPPLVGSDWVLGNPEVPIRVVLHGLEGELTIDGKLYGDVIPMPAQAVSLRSDQEVAEVLTYIRSQWGNSAEPITEAQVAEVRAQHPDQVMWKASELAPLLDD